MYLPKHFEETRVEVLHELIRAHPLATLVVLSSRGLEANHIPLELDPAPAPFGTLRGHIARANPLGCDFSPEVETLVIFQGPEAYISPSWYPSKQETARVVPTWNYAVVHAYGPLRVIQDRAWLRNLVERLTDQQEAARRAPWQVADAPSDYIAGLLDAIVGIEIPITRLLGKFKLSQNRPARDRAGVIEGLLCEGDDAATALAELVRHEQLATGKETT